ncbi:hypothetical protein RSO01_68140 [Reyranella soli]|uniref:Uncharacterized protein n=1 Tax=Reyranella soli TaxID=1230389 RepID=A0A512NL27_9HYPH|nr:hypothetical protein RSO01_68140 [Reyranella soli]
MGEHDHLTVGGLGNEPFRDGLPMHVVERRNRIVKDNAGFVVGGGEFSHERSEGDATMFAFAQDLPDRGIRFSRERDFETGG